MADTTTTRDADTIRRDIRRTRADMDETVDELTQRLTPGRLLDEIWARVTDGNGNGHAGGADGIGAVVRDHPVPLALMGLGLGWLAVEQANGRSSHDADVGTHQRAEGRRGPYTGDAVADDPDWEHADLKTRATAKARAAKESVKDAASSVGDAASDAAASVKDTLTDAKDSVRDKADDLGSEASRRTHEAREATERRARAAGRKTREGFWSLLEDKPLALGAIAFGLGLASGVSVPSTDAEDRVMGDASDTLKDEARRKGRETARKAKRVAEDAADAAVEEARRQNDRRDLTGSAQDAVGRTVEEAREAAGEVGRAVKDAVRTRAEAEGITTRTEDPTP